MIDGRNIYDQPINDLIKQYDEVRKVSTGNGDDCTTGYLLDYVCFKTNCSWFKETKALDADPREIQQTVFQGVVRGADKTKIRLYTILEQSKEIVLKFNKETPKVLWIVWMVEYSKVNVKLSNSQLNKSKIAAKNQTEVTLRINIKMFNGNNLPHELLSTKDKKLN